MNAKTQDILITLTLAFLLLNGALLSAAPAIAFEPTKYVFYANMGWEVDATTKNTVCTATSKDQCQQALHSGEPGGFSSPQSIAVAPKPSEDIYISDNANQRVQELTPQGAFVLMFGREVNKNGSDICHAGEGCQVGKEGTGPGEFRVPRSIAVDPQTGNVYVLDSFNYRVQELTPSGEFVLMIGRHVNKTTGSDLCTEQEIKSSGVECQAGSQNEPGSSEPGAFRFNAQHWGSLLTVSGPENLLYVGDEGRIQEFKADGTWVKDIPLPSTITVVEALAVDKAGHVYVAYNTNLEAIHMLEPSGVQVGEFKLVPRAEEGKMRVASMSLDAYGRLAVMQTEALKSAPSQFPGYVRVYSTRELGRPVTEVVSPFGPIEFSPAVATAPSGQLYMLSSPGEVVSLAPVVFPEARTCTVGEVLATSAVLCGEIDPNGLSTTGFFVYGAGAGGLVSQTPVVFGPSEGEAFSPVHFGLSGLVPNESYRYEVVAQAEVQGKAATQAGEPAARFHTPTPSPEIPGEPSASNVSDHFAVLSTTVNPEHALAHYHFQYGPCKTLTACAEVSSTNGAESAQYGLVPAVQEATGLQPDTTYSYRLVANNEHVEPADVLQGGQTTGAEGHFTTAPLPSLDAQTGPASTVGATTAVISGSVNPDGAPAAYSFELGVYAGASTQYGIVVSGSAGAGVGLVQETFALSGLQAGTTYAYRIRIKSGYGETVGQPVLFTTEGLPAVLSVPVALPLLTVPDIVTPPPVTSSLAVKRTARCRQGYRRDRHGRCIKVVHKRKTGKRARKHRKGG